MEIFLNPNVDYLILVTGFVLIMLAIITPGTGILEITAVFALIAVGYSFFQVPINLWALFVIFLGAVLFGVSIWRTKQRITLALSLILIIIGSVYLFQGQTWWQPAVNPLLAFLVSVVVMGFFWIAGRKAIEASLVLPHHELDQLIGLIGEAKTDISQEGTVQVESELWSAYSHKPIQQGSRVRIIKRDGFLLEVEKEDEPNTH